MSSHYLVGADPEIFVKRDGRVIGSEKVVPEIESIVAQDGVQVEFHPPASMNPSILGSWISQAFIRLDMLSKAAGASISFDQVVEVERAELNSLSPKNRILGSDPSRNIYGIKPLVCDPETYQVRSAAGHLHFGLRGDLFDERVRLVGWLDVIVGNTCVLIDREPKAALRRENYGRAGEYRLPNHGLEYRTLSNFWLRNYTLLDFVLGLANIAVDIVEHPSFESTLIDIVDIQRAVKAIDTNDKELAWVNFKDLSKTGLFNRWPPTNLANWVETIQNKGLEKVFREDPVTGWIRGKQVPFSEYIKQSRNWVGGF